MKCPHCNDGFTNAGEWTVVCWWCDGRGRFRHAAEYAQRERRYEGFWRTPAMTVRKDIGFQFGEADPSGGL